MRNDALLGQRCSRSTDLGIFISRRICRWRSSRGVMKKVASGKRSRVSRSVEVLVTDVAILPIVLPIQSLLIVGKREVGAGADRSAGLAMWLSVVHAQPVVCVWWFQLWSQWQRVPSHWSSLSADRLGIIVFGFFLDLSLPNWWHALARSRLADLRLALVKFDRYNVALVKTAADKLVHCKSEPDKLVLASRDWLRSIRSPNICLTERYLLNLP